ncbi:hypothetical protein JR316_0006206 [Psilocybe cubensis]|nr:hypothetical protein JR316_0006206 [Psilocybe cubensis]KAH9481679.1 hypothetical protein JR316_0006206 [Psilocybe cubensis]
MAHLSQQSNAEENNWQGEMAISSEMIPNEAAHVHEPLLANWTAPSETHTLQNSNACSATASFEDANENHRKLTPSPILDTSCLMDEDASALSVSKLFQEQGISKNPMTVQSSGDYEARMENRNNCIHREVKIERSPGKDSLPESAKIPPAFAAGGIEQMTLAQDMEVELKAEIKLEETTLEETVLEDIKPDIDVKLEEIDLIQEIEELEAKLKDKKRQLELDVLRPKKRIKREHSPIVFFAPGEAHDVIDLT